MNHIAMVLLKTKSLNYDKEDYVLRWNDNESLFQRRKCSVLKNDL